MNKPSIEELKPKLIEDKTIENYKILPGFTMNSTIHHFHTHLSTLLFVEPKKKIAAQIINISIHSKKKRRKIHLEQETM